MVAQLVNILKPVGFQTLTGELSGYVNCLKKAAEEEGKKDKKEKKMEEEEEEKEKRQQGPAGFRRLVG